MNKSKPKNNFTFRCFVADDSVQCNLLPCERISRSLFSVKASQKVQVPKPLIKRSDDVVMRGGKSRNSNFSLKALHGSQEQAKPSAVRCGLDEGVQHSVPKFSSAENCTSKRAQSVSETGDTVKPQKKVSRNGKRRDENVGKSTKKDVKSATSIPPKNRSATTQNDQAQLKPNGQPSKKSDDLLSVDTSTSSASSAQGSTFASQGKKPNAASVGQTSQIVDKKVHPYDI